jgi:hypothetical protein
MPRTQKYMHTPRGTNGLSRARHLRFGYTRVLRDYTCRVPRILRRRRRNTNCQGDAALAVVASLAPPHERCRASLNATHGKILLICFLLAGTSQRSPKTTRYRHSGSQKHCRKCTSARPRFHVSCQTERVRSPDKSLSEVELAQPATQLTFPTSKKRGAFISSQPCLLTLPLKFWKG